MVFRTQYVSCQNPLQKTTSKNHMWTLSLWRVRESYKNDPTYGIRWEREKVTYSISITFCFHMKIVAHFGKCGISHWFHAMLCFSCQTFEFIYEISQCENVQFTRPYPFASEYFNLHVKSQILHAILSKTRRVSCDVTSVPFCLLFFTSLN